MARAVKLARHTRQAFQVWLDAATPELLALAKEQGRHPAAVASTQLRFILNDHFRAYLPGGSADDSRAKARVATLTVTDERGEVLTAERPQTVAGVRGVLDYVAAAVAEMYHPQKPPLEMRRAELRKLEAAVSNRLFRGKGSARYAWSCPFEGRVFTVAVEIETVDTAP